ncbi:uncharacterized protein M6G45_015971 isoform 2-T2 [Spheniscus humboldti]
MEPRGVRMGWLCIAVLCSGAALVLKEEEPGHQSDDISAPTRDPTTTTGIVDKLTMWPTVTPTPPWTGDPITNPLPTQAGAGGNKTQNASAVPIRYWSPAIFVVVALLVLFFTYRWTKGEDLGALDHLPIHNTTPIIPTPQEEKRPEKAPTLEHTKTTFCEPDPPPPQLLPPQPDTPTAAGGPRCSGEPGAD